MHIGKRFLNVIFRVVTFSVDFLQGIPRHLCFLMFASSGGALTSVFLFLMQLDRIRFNLEFETSLESI